MQSLQRKREWASLGLEVARVLLADGAQTREGHVEVTGQVRGYLRWYGDLTALRGYEPLAEAISMGLQKRQFEKEDFVKIKSLYASEWDTPASFVHSAVRNTMFSAFDCHPAFASLVLGGLERTVTILQFVQASIEWLKEYCLINHYFSGNEREAAWHKTLRPACFKSYISMEEQEIVTSLGRGHTLTALSEKLNYPTERVELLYAQAVERATYLLKTVPAQPLEETADEIANGLMKIGFVLHSAGVTELRTAIRLSRNDPKLLEQMQDGLYSAVGEELNMGPSAVSYRIHGALRMVYKRCRQTGEYTDFYRASGLLEQPFSIKRFITAFLLYQNQTTTYGGEIVEVGKM